MILRSVVLQSPTHFTFSGTSPLTRNMDTMTVLFSTIIFYTKQYSFGHQGLQLTLCGYKVSHSSAPIFAPRQTADWANQPKRESLSNLPYFAWTATHWSKMQKPPLHMCTADGKPMKTHRWRLISAFWYISKPLSSLKCPNVNRSLVKSPNTSSLKEASPETCYCFPVLKGEEFLQQKLFISETTGS